MTGLLELAERCEAATGNEDIAWFDDLARTIHELDPRSNVNGTCKNYPRSVDAALTLVPEGWTFDIVSLSDHCRVVLYGPSRQKTAVIRGATPALAICAAALRAQEATLRCLAPSGFNRLSRGEM